jgi:hypothetical protein
MNRNERQIPILAVGIGCRRRMWTWPASGAFLGLAGSGLAGIAGAILAAMALFTDSGWMHTGGTILLVSMIPLLMCGAHCLDLVDQQLLQAKQQKEFEKKQTMKLTYKQPTNRRASAGIVTALVAVAVLLVMTAPTKAQQTVFNVPTTDVLDKGKVYFELDISAKPNDSDALNKFSSFVPRVVVGTGGRVEIGLNVLGNIQPGADSTTLVPAIKVKLYDGKDNGWAVVTGAHLYVPVRNKSYNAGTYEYLQLSKMLGAKTRVGFGGYFFSKNVVAPNANRGGGQFTFEQTVTKRLNINADWFTGKQSSGYLTIGPAFKLTKKLTGVAAYSIGNANASKGNHFLYFELGYNFN